jgi:hypothetical protein
LVEPAIRAYVTEARPRPEVASWLEAAFFRKK